jgi:SAM-dependent methyltransferase
MKKNHTQTLDLPETTIQRRKIIVQKKFLYNTYKYFYKLIYSSLNIKNRRGTIVELGSGAGFIKKIIPHVITSDILKLPKIDMQFSATKMPFKKNTLNGIVMVDVFHHIADVEKFLKEAERCLKKDGQIIMIEPASTLLGKLIYRYLHHEAYNSKAKWAFESNGPLSSANTALPWIVFYRDEKQFKKKFTTIKVIKITPHTPIKYLFSGGFSYPQLLPNYFESIIDLLEKLLKPLNFIFGMFYTINIVKYK